MKKQIGTKDIKEYIANQIRLLNNIGVVHDRNKLPKTSGEFKTLFEYDGRVQGWVITRSGLGGKVLNASFLKIPETYLIVTFFGFSDSNDSETSFDASIDRVYDIFARDTNLGGLVANITSLSVPEYTLIKVGDIYSHYAEIVLDIERFRQ